MADAMAMHKSAMRDNVMAAFTDWMRVIARDEIARNLESQQQETSAPSSSEAETSDTYSAHLNALEAENRVLVAHAAALGRQVFALKAALRKIADAADLSSGEWQDRYGDSLHGGLSAIAKAALAPDTGGEEG